jgi:hypothetical protein
LKLDVKLENVILKFSSFEQYEIELSIKAILFVSSDIWKGAAS